MSLILSKPKNIECPSEEQLRSYYKDNCGEIGYMFVKNGKVIIHKGFYRFCDFYKDFLENYSKNIPIVIHFRTEYATTGRTTYSDQPYVVANNVDEGNCYIASCDVAFVHNGYISKLSSYTTSISDSLLFGVEYLSLIATGKEWHNDRKNVELVNKLIGDYNTMAIMSSDERIELLGRFYFKDGVSYSKEV